MGPLPKMVSQPPQKPQDVFSSKLLPPELLRQRTSYDEYILYLDQEFGRLFDYLESSGALDNTWVVLTADHGELFERGVRGHISPLLYQPVVRIPLMIFEPGSTARVDIHSRDERRGCAANALACGRRGPGELGRGYDSPALCPDRARRRSTHLRSARQEK